MWDGLWSMVSLQDAIAMWVAEKRIAREEMLLAI